MLLKEIIFIYLLILCIQQSQSNYENVHDHFIERKRREEQPTTVNSDNSNRRSIVPSLSSSLLSNSKECKLDVQKYCTKGIRQFISNLKVLECIDDLDQASTLISTECQNLIYNFKYNMTHNLYFDNAAMNFCAKDIKLLEECNEHTDELGTSRLVSCLYDRLNNITDTKCRNFIKHVRLVIFTDWRLSEFFTTACLSHITEFKCGRLDDDNSTLPHDQGAVISCLSKNHNKLSKACLKHIYRLHEMQSDDYHLDRALYYACRDDRERLCGQVLSGSGRVYRCLYEQKFNSMMTSSCRNEVHRRQKVVASNVLSDAPFMKACNSEIVEHKCAADSSNTDGKLSLVRLLLCLEDRKKKGNQINDECQREMLIHRRMLMSDYALSPEIIATCDTEINQHCHTLLGKDRSSTTNERGGRVIHCLLNAARRDKTFTPDCLRDIQLLMRAVDPGSDIRVAPFLETACRSVIDVVCPKIKAGHSNIILCLLDNLKNARMTDECEEHLMGVSYFMQRDWRLTPKLLTTCQKSLIDFCQLPSDWTMSSNMTDLEVGKYLNCLYHEKDKIKGECRIELKRLMRIRTQSIGLMPEIEDNCISDLATCKNPDLKGEELKCLQRKYKTLEDQCKNAVKKYTQLTISDPTLDFILMKSCESMIQMFCPNVHDENNNGLLHCLIRNKNNQNMEYKCKVNIEHHQIMSLKGEISFSEQFKRKCNQEIEQHCSMKKTKAGAIQCLSKIILQDVRLKQKRITQDCQEELKFELLQRSENINLDPALRKACGTDIQTFCSSINSGNSQIIDCLKKNTNRVSSICYSKLKSREKIDVVLPGNDYSLTTKCSATIQKYCPNEKNQNILSCLRRNINQDIMSNDCRAVLHHRLMILNSDARFNKALIENCQNDINKYCSAEVTDEDDDNRDDDDDEDDDDDDQNSSNNNNNDNLDNANEEIQDRDMGGRIIECLRSKYADTHIELESKCTTEIADVIQASKIDIELDVKLYQKCKNIINDKCINSDKEDCLKLLYQKNQLTDKECQNEVIRIIKEGHADIHIDTVLFTSCQADIFKYCNNIPIGNGKQLECLLKMKNSVTNYCRNILMKRQELWSSISDIDNFNDLVGHIKKSSNNTYFFTGIILFTLIIFIAGCVLRPLIRYRRVRKYK